VTTLAPTFVGSSSWVAATVNNSITLSYPSGLQEGDYVYAQFVMKSDSASVTAPGGWTTIQNSTTLGSGTIGAGTGPGVIIILARSVPSGGLSGTVDFTINSNTAVGSMLAIRPPSGATLVQFYHAGSIWTRTSASTTFGGTGSAAIAFEPGDILLATSFSADDQSSSHTFGSFTVTGCTLSSVAVQPPGTITNSLGSDISAASAYVQIKR